MEPTSTRTKDNGGAYEKWELRNGPPLEYVSEKLRAGLEELHHLLSKLSDEASHQHAERCFYYSIVSFLALHNRLSLADEHEVIDRLMTVEREVFKIWLDEIVEGSSVLG